MNLYDSLFPNDASSSDFGLNIIEDIHGHLNFEEMSKYYDVTSYDEIPQNDSKYLRILHLNARGLTQMKIASFIALLNSLKNKPDIICFTETDIRIASGNFSCC